MGAWITLHLMDEEKLLKEVIPSMNSNTAKLQEDVAEYLSYFHIGGTDRLTEEQLLKLISRTLTDILDTANQFETILKQGVELKSSSIAEQKIIEICTGAQYYHFACFFEYKVFSTCADFFPHIPLGYIPFG